MLLFRDEYLKKLRYQLTLSQNIDDQRTLQSDWMKHNLPNLTKTSSLKNYLTLMTISLQKIEGINYFQKY